MNSVNPLARLDTANRLLAEARTVDEVKLVRDQAEAMRIYAPLEAMEMAGIDPYAVIVREA